MDFNKLKQKQKTNSIQDLTKSLENATGKKKNYNDEREWTLKGDDAGNGYAIIRFLPSPDEDCTGFVKLHTHGFKNATGQWFFENCPGTIGEKCPVCEANKELWDSGLEANKNIARERKKKTNFYSNILVIKDSNNPENEGKVFIYRYGQKIFEKIKEAAMPDESFGETPINAFDMFNGANFKLKMRKVGGFPNYDQSTFDTASPVAADEAKIEEIWKKTYSLKEFVSKDKFKSYAEIKERFQRFLNRKNDVSSTAETIQSKTESYKRPSHDEDDVPSYDVSDAPSHTHRSMDDEDDGNDALAEFQNLLA